MDNKLQYDKEGRVVLEHSVEEMLKRKAAFEYLTHLEEVRHWMERINPDIMPQAKLSVIDFEENFRNGVILAKLANTIGPAGKIYDPDYARFKEKGLEFRHTENVITLRNFYTHHGLPEIILPTTVDIYDKKNMPRLIYSLHAIAVLLYKKGIIKFNIADLSGQFDFAEDEINKIQNEFDKLGISLPEFGKIDGMIANEVKVGEAERLAAIIRINQALEEKNVEHLIESLNHPNAELQNIQEDLADAYMTVMNLGRNQKIESNKTMIENTAAEDLDYFMQNLTQKEIQKAINETNFENLLKTIDHKIADHDSTDLIRLLRSPALQIQQVLIDQHIDYYLDGLTEKRNHQKEYFDKSGDYYLDKKMIQDAIADAFEKADQMIKMKNAIIEVNETIQNNNQENFNKSIANPALSLENLCEDRFGEYLKEMHDKYENDKTYFEKPELQDMINKINGELETQKRIKSALDEIRQDAERGDFEKFKSHIRSSTLNFDLNQNNLHLYMEKVKENPDCTKSIEALCEMIKDADQIYDLAQKLALATISFTENISSQNEVQDFLSLDIAAFENVDEKNIEHYVESFKEQLQQIQQQEMLKEDKNQRQINTGFFGGFLKCGRPYFYDESSNIVYWSKSHMKEMKLEDFTRLSLKAVQSIIDRVNAFQNVVSQGGDIDKLQDVIRAISAYYQYHNRYKHFGEHQQDIESIQSFLMNLVKKGDWNDLMSGKMVKLPTIAKFVNILMATDYDLKSMKEHAELKQQVRSMIIELKKNTDTSHELDVSLGLLIQSNYSEKLKHKKSVQNDAPFIDMRQERAESLHKYGVMFFWLHSRPKYLASLLHALDESEGLTSVEGIMLSLYNYLSTQQEEARALKCLQLSFMKRLESKGGVEFLTSGNPMTLRVFIILTRHLSAQKLEPFLKLFTPTIDEIISESNLNYSLDPLSVYLQVVKGQPPMDLTISQAMENPEVAARIKDDIEMYKKYVGQLVDAFCENYSKIPFFLRSMMRFIYECPNLTKKDKRNICGNIMFNKLLSPMITSPDSFEMTSKKSENIKEKHRKFLSDVSQILYAVSIERGFNEEYLEDLNDFISENHSKLKKCYSMVVDIPKDEEYYQISHRSDFAVDTDSVTIKIEDALTLHKLLLENEDKLSPKPNDVLVECLQNFRNPHIDNFLRDTSIDQVSKAEMAYRHVVIQLMPSIKSDKNKQNTDKHKMKHLKLLVCQLLFSVDQIKYSPGDIDDLMEHVWTPIELESHEKHTAIIKEIAESSAGNKMQFGEIEDLTKNLTDIQAQCKALLGELVESGALSHEDQYQTLIDLIAADIRNEHARKIEMQREHAALVKSREDVEAKNKATLAKINFMENYITSLKKNLSSSKSSKRKSIFSRKSSKSGKPKDYSVDSLIKQAVIESADATSYGTQTKNLQIKVVPSQEGQYEIQLSVSGKKVEQATINIEEALISIYKNQESRELFKGLVFSNRLLYERLLKDN